MFKKIIILMAVSVILLTTSFCFASLKPAGEFTKEQAIQKFFINRELDFVEGIWKSAVWKDEFIIVKNVFGIIPESKYLGLFIKESSGTYQNGEVAYTFIPTGSAQMFTGETFGYMKALFFTSRKNFDTTYVISSNNTIQVTAEELGRDTLIKLYPIETVPKQNQQISSGTGFFIASDLILTNNHVVNNAKEIEITLSGSAKYSAKIITKDAVNDLAILKISGIKENINPLSIGQVKDVKSGDRVVTIGFPLGSQLGTRAKISEGIINSTVGMEDDGRMYQISIPVQPGNSGGPLFNSKGQVIGVVTAGLGLKYLLKEGIIPQNVNFAMKISYLQNLLMNIPDDIKLATQESQQDLNAREIMDLAEEAVVFIKATN